MRIIAGKYRGKKLLSPTCAGTRPTSDRARETLFNILLNNSLFGPHVLYDKAVLDIFAGTGALGLEALSRGAKSITFIENNKDILPILYKNAQACNLSPSCVLEQDVRFLSSHLSSPFDLIFMDPPYRQNLILPTLRQLFEKKWIGKNSLIVIELAKDEGLSLPPNVSLVLERTAGIAKLLFCCISP